MLVRLGVKQGNPRLITPLHKGFNDKKKRTFFFFSVANKRRLFAKNKLKTPHKKATVKGTGEGVVM